MKKILLSAFALFIFTACGSDVTRDVAYLEPELTSEDIQALKDGREFQVIEEEEEEAEEDEDETPAENSANFVRITSPKNQESITKSADESITFNGEVPATAEKVTVEAKGKGYTDVYALQDFKKGSTTFSYRARQDWQNLAPGENTYTFKVDFADGTSKSTKVTINFTEK